MSHQRSCRVPLKREEAGREGTLKFTQCGMHTTYNTLYTVPWLFLPTTTPPNDRKTDLAVSHDHGDAPSHGTGSELDGGAMGQSLSSPAKQPSYAQTANQILESALNEFNICDHLWLYQNATSAINPYY